LDAADVRAYITAELEGAAAAAQSASQPLDADLTLLAALTTAPYGRNFLTVSTESAARTYLGLFMLRPSGGDDAPIISAMVAQVGGAYLSYGVFSIQTPLNLVSPIQWRAGITGKFAGAKLFGSGMDLTVLDMTTLYTTIKTHDQFSVTALTLGATTVAQVTGHTFSAGDKVILDCPVLTSVGNTTERLNGCIFYIKIVDANNVELCNDPALAQSINSTGWGAFGSPTFLRRYTTSQTAGYTPAIRIQAPLSVGVRQSIYGGGLQDLTVTARNTAYPSNYDRQGIALAFEADTLGTNTNNSSTAQGIKIANVHFDGFDTAMLFDDVTNAEITGCSLQNNNHALWRGYNVDIVKWTECRFGEDVLIAGTPSQHVSIYSPIWFLPNNDSVNPPGSASIETFEGCWYMGVLGISLNQSPRANVSGAIGSAPNAAGQVFISGGYAEQVRKLVDANALLIVDGLTFGSFSRGQNLTNQDCIFTAFGNVQFPTIILRGMTSDSGTGPKYGYLLVGDQTGTNELYNPHVDWAGNRVPQSTTNPGHIQSVSGRWININDGVISGNSNKARGDYQFNGLLQCGGDDIINVRTEAAATPSFTPQLFTEGLVHVVPSLAGNCTVGNPQMTTSVTTFATSFAGTFATRLQILKMKPIKFIFKQDGTGGRTISFGTDFVTTGLDNGATNGVVNATTEVVFKYNGNKFILVSANTWAV